MPPISKALVEPLQLNVRGQLVRLTPRLHIQVDYSNINTSINFFTYIVLQEPKSIRWRPHYMVLTPPKYVGSLIVSTYVICPL